MSQLSEYHRRFYYNLITHRKLIWELAIRDLGGRYRGSALGFAWSFLNPILLMVIYSTVFRSIGSFDIDHYSLYVLIGVLTWNCISGCISESCYAIQGSLALVSKTSLPPEVIAAKTVLSQIMNFSLSMIVYILFSVFIFKHIASNWLYFPFLIFFLTIFLGALCFGLSIISAIFKDVDTI